MHAMAGFVMSCMIADSESANYLDFAGGRKVKRKGNLEDALSRTCNQFRKKRPLARSRDDRDP